MNYYYFIPLVLGTTVVIQGTLNKTIGQAWGLSSAVLLNAAVFFVLALAFYLLSKLRPDILPEFLRAKPINEFKLVYFVPGICGFILVLGLPWGMLNLGAAKTLIILISSQILTSILMDIFINEVSISSAKLIGAVFTFLGALITLFA